ncbi:MAG TPA: M13 family metallopeptidase [Candidatus Baltobacteraceae bacterium]|nr:M13 family metallopeptidase [Candidatus Baltobacteraceae bacterium]
MRISERVVRLVGPGIWLSAMAFVIVATGQPARAQQATEPSHGVVVGNIDPEVKPGDDFFRYCNGAWLKRTEIPADRGSVSVVLALRDKSDQRVKALVEEAAKANAAPGTNTRKIADLFHSYMDEAGIEAKGMAPLEPHLKAIAAIQDKKALAFALGKTLRADVDALNNTNFHTANLFGLWVAPDFNDPEHYAAYLMQGGLQLPDREYYTGESDRMKNLRTAYQAHVAAMLKLAGFSDPEARAAKIVALEHAIAEKHLTLAENEDVHKANNPWKRTEFAAKAPGLDWAEYFRGAGLTKQENFIVWQPGAFAGESALVTSEPLETWKDFLAYHMIEAYGGVLPKGFADERFAFFGKTLQGTTEQRPRWARAVTVVNVWLGDAVGQLYAKQYFPPESKARVEKMVANIEEAFRKRIDALTWMDPATKAEAKAKLSTLYVGIGYTEHWMDYSGYDIKPDDIFGNLWRGNLFVYTAETARLGKPVDRQEWTMTPQTVNAVNLPLQNALSFPAAFLEPPFFDANAQDAFNYGAIGAVIGHEVSHTFDAEGSAFDSKGRVRNWWTPADLAHFEASTQKLVEQYDKYKPFPDLALNGKQTIDENIADVAGIAASYDAYHAALGGNKAAEQAGFSGDQQFFLAYGQTRASKPREGALRQQVLTDPHSPSEYRTDAVRNIDAWYPAFQVKESEKLYLKPEERVKIW